jgi:MSHA biogenesis protein MshJ
MKARIAQWAERFEAFSLRERALISAAVLVLLYLLWDTALMSPEHLRQRQLIGEMYSLNQRMADMDTQIGSLTQKLSAGGARQANRRIQDMRTTLAGLAQQERALTVEFIQPRQMAGVLRQMLGAESGLTLIGLQSLGAEPLFPPQKDEAGKNTATAGEPQIYKHGMRVTFEGDFFATVRYLQALEAMSWRFYWDDLDYQVEAYPQARVAITVHTLSLDQGWLGV